MSSDFSAYQNIIDNFKGKVGKPGFDQEYNAATKHLESKERFLLKMELKRLATPCVRLIDLRGHVDGECKEVVHEGRTHMLDTIAERVFRTAVKQYGGYTFGVYEEAKRTENNFRVRNEKARKAAADGVVISDSELTPAHDKQHFPAHFVAFGQYVARAEERMNYVLSLTIINSKGEQFSGHSSDVSASGLKIKFDELNEFHLGEKIEVIFTGLEQDFQLDKNKKLYYQIQNQQISMQHFVGAERCDFDKEQDPFYQFLLRYINGYKRRYKINLDNTIDSIHSRGYEQFSVPNTSMLPVIMEGKGNRIIPAYMLNSGHNYSVGKFWKNEQNESTLEFLITADRLKRLASMGESETLRVYAFAHESKGRTFFYSADHQQLQEMPHLQKYFLAFASRKEKFGIFQLSYRSIKGVSPDSDLSIKNFLEVRDAYLKQPLSQDVEARLKDFKHMVLVEDLTHVETFGRYDYLALDPNISAHDIKVFGHQRPNKHAKVESIKLNYASMRAESRFAFVTPIEVSDIEQQKDRQLGKTVDFSTLGLKIELDKPGEFKKGDIVCISLPKLQKITSKFDLKDLPYLVVNNNDDCTVINLKVYVQEHQHIGRSFFKLLIEKNKSKLESDSDSTAMPGLAKALRNIFARRIPSLSMYIQTSGSRYKIEQIGSSKSGTPMLEELDDLSSEEGEYNLFPFLHAKGFESQLSEVMKKQVNDPTPAEFCFFIKYTPNKVDIDQAVNSKLYTEFNSEHQARFFIRNAKRKGRFHCIRVVISRTDIPSMAVLGPELNYLSNYAIHRAKAIEETLWSVVGVAEAFDITDEILARYNLIGEDIPQDNELLETQE